MTVTVPAPPSQTSASTLELVEKHNDDVCQPRTLEKSEQPTATFCSSTLEMGIDVGNVKLVGQIGAPWSVSSLTQRLGRSGRKEGETSVIRIYIAEDEPVQNTSLFDRLFLKLLQATAMTELMREKWCEPLEVDRHEGYHIGNIAFVPEFQEGKFLILAGRRWQILHIDHERMAITVQPSPGRRVPGFHGERGQDIHPRVRQAMKDLLKRADLAVYLDLKAREMLLQARLTAQESGLFRASFLQDGADALWFTWTGSRVQRLLFGLEEFFGGLTITDESIALVFEKTTVARVQEIYSGFLTDCPDAISLARKYPHRIREKYEIYLSDDLTAELFARERIELKGAIAKVRELGE
jgi:Helicase conserved C-terminal domain